MPNYNVKCYSCGYVVGQFKGDPTNSWSEVKFRPAGSTEFSRLSKAPRCKRCGGSVYAEDQDRMFPSEIEPALA